MKALILTLTVLTATALGYHEFKTPKKAYKKATIEYFSNEKQKTEPDSTVTIFYDKNDVEMYREVKKGCGNVIGGLGDSLYLHRAIDSGDSLYLHRAIDSSDIDGIIYEFDLRVDDVRH